MVTSVRHAGDEEARMFPTVVLVAATLSMALFAGLFFTYATSIMVGLQRTDDQVFVSAMQWFNATIVNVWFAFSFLGSGVLTALAAVLHRGSGNAVLPWTVAALVCYVATFAITMGINVPLNNELAAAGEPEPGAAVAAVRERFERRWVRWNNVRAVTSLAALGCMLGALVVRSGV
jgi:uncharacterized membrane protein